jgi:hypothetical protein
MRNHVFYRADDVFKGHGCCTEAIYTVYEQQTRILLQGKVSLPARIEVSVGIGELNIPERDDIRHLLL